MYIETLTLVPAESETDAQDNEQLKTINKKDDNWKAKSNWSAVTKPNRGSSKRTTEQYSSLNRPITLRLERFA